MEYHLVHVVLHRVNEEFALKDSTHQTGISASPQEIAQRQGNDEVRRRSFEVDNLMGHRRPENCEASCIDNRPTSAEEVTQRTRREQIQFDLVVSVRSGHASRFPQLAREAVGRELGASGVELFHAP